MTLRNNTQTRLMPALSLFGFCSSFKEAPGKYKCKLHVDQGDILFCHGAYNLETGCWNDRPDAGEASQILIHEGETKDLEFTCGEHYGQADDIWIYNNSYLKPASFICSYEKQ